MKDQKKMNEYNPYKQVLLNENLELKPPKNKKHKDIKPNKKGRPFVDNILEGIFVFFMTSKKIYIFLIFLSLMILGFGVFVLPLYSKIAFCIVYILIYSLFISIYNKKNNGKTHTKEQKNDISKEEYESNIKELSKYFKNVKFDKNGSIDKNEILKKSLVSNGDYIESSYYIKGEYNNIVFQNSNIKVYDNNRNLRMDKKRKKQKVSTVLDSIQYFFDGQWIIVQTNIKSDNSIFIWTNNFSYPNIEYCLNNNFVKISTKDEIFNQNFILYAKNKSGLAQIIPPSIIAELNNFVFTERKKIPGFELGICFDNKNLKIAFNIESYDVRVQTKFIIEILDIFSWL